MAHELDITNGQVSFVGAQSAWHRLGQIKGREFTAEEALRDAHLGGWNVHSAPKLQAVLADGTILEIDDKRASVRTNPITGLPEYLGVVGSDFGHVQNEEQVAFLGALTDRAPLVTAGAIRGGRQVFFACKLPEGLLIGGVDRVDLYLVVLNAHDGSQAFSCIATPVRPVCANTVAAGLSRAHQRWTRRHTGTIGQAVSEAQRDLDLTWKYAGELQDEFDRMIQTPLLDSEFEDVIGRIYGAPANDDSPVTARHKIERLAVLRGLYHDASTQADIRGTRYAGYHAIVEREDHLAKVRGAGSHDERRALRAIDGLGLKIKERAFREFRVSV